MTTPTLKDGLYFVQNVATSTVLTANGDLTTNPGLVCDAYSVDKIDRQLWKVKQVGAQTYAIILYSSGNVADLKGANPDDLTPIIVFPNHWGTNQTWTITAAGSNWQVTNLSSGKALDLTGGNPNPGTAVINFKSHGSTNQLWAFKQVISTT